MVLNLLAGSTIVVDQESVLAEDVDDVRFHRSLFFLELIAVVGALVIQNISANMTPPHIDVGYDNQSP